MRHDHEWIFLGMGILICIIIGLVVLMFIKIRNEKFGNSNANLICDFSLDNEIQVNYESGGCSTGVNGVNGVIKFINDNFHRDISGDCRKDSFYKLDLSDDDAKKICNYIIN